MNYTDNYTLKLPSSEGEFSDVADINDLNENFIAIDSELAKKTDKTYSDNLILLQEAEPTDPTKITLWFEIEGEEGYSMGGITIGNAETSDIPPTTGYWFDPLD